MALSREQKEAIVTELTQLLSDSKMTVLATYTGLSVKDMQALRKSAKESNTRVLVTKNRLFKLAASQVDHLKNVDLSGLDGQILYAFNNVDEVASAQSLHAFAKDHPQLTFVGAITETGEFMDVSAVTQLAELPSKEQLQAQLVGTIAAPLSGLVGVLSGNLRGFAQVLNARKEQLEG